MKFVTSFYNKLLLSFLLVAVVPLTFLVGLTYVDSKQAAIGRIFGELQTLATEKLGHLHVRLHEAQMDLESIARTLSNRDLRRGDPEGRIRKELLSKIQERPEYLGIFVVDIEGHVVSSSRLPIAMKHVSGQPWFRKGMESTASVLADLNYYDFLEGLALSFSVPIFASQERSQKTGHLFAFYDWGELLRFMREETIFGQVQTVKEFALLLNRNRQVVAGPDFLFPPARSQGTRNFKVDNFLPFPDSKMTAEDDFAAVNRWNGKDYFMGSSQPSEKGPLKALGWSVLVLKERSLAMAQSHDLKTRYFLFAFFGVLLAFILTMLLSKQVRQPIAQLTQAAQKVSEGNLEVRIPDSSSDEIGELARTFNRMIEELKSSREEILVSKANAEEASVAKSEFLARMSHELRTPMNAILGFAQLLEMNADRPVDKEQKDYIKTILKSGNHLLKLINEILDLSRIETGQMKVSTETVDVEMAVNDAVEMFKPMAEEADVTLILSEKNQRGLYAYADFSRLKQALLILLSNAIKYNRSGGSVTVEWSESEEETVCIRVMDTGSGIPETEMNRVFEPFRRLVSANSSIEGTGIGLTICKRLVELMNGTLSLASKMGQGTWVTITLPKSTEQVEMVVRTSEQEPAVAPSTGKSKITILYIEDNPVNLELLRQIVSQLPDVSLLSAPEALLGIELARHHRPDLILMDIHLPGMDGLTAVKKMRLFPETRNIPVWVVSADAMVKDIKYAMSFGIERYITKPIDVPDFVDKLNRFLENVRS